MLGQSDLLAVHLLPAYKHAWIQRIALYVRYIHDWYNLILGRTFQVIFCSNISYNSTNSSTLSTHKLSTDH